LKYLIEFIEAKNIKKSVIYRHLKCSEEEAKLVQYVCRRYVKGLEEVPVLEMLQENFRGEPYLYLKKLPLVILAGLCRSASDKSRHTIFHNWSWSIRR